MNVVAILLIPTQNRKSTSVVFLSSIHCGVFELITLALYRAFRSVLYLLVCCATIRVYGLSAGSGAEDNHALFGERGHQYAAGEVLVFVFVMRVFFCLCDVMWGLQRRSGSFKSIPMEPWPAAGCSVRRKIFWHMKNRRSLACVVSNVFFVGTSLSVVDSTSMYLCVPRIPTICRCVFLYGYPEVLGCVPVLVWSWFATAIFTLSLHTFDSNLRLHVSMGAAGRRKAAWLNNFESTFTSVTRLSRTFVNQNV